MKRELDLQEDPKKQIEEDTKVEKDKCPECNGKIVMKSYQKICEQCGLLIGEPFEFSPKMIRIKKKIDPYKEVLNEIKESFNELLSNRVIVFPIDKDKTLFIPANKFFETLHEFINKFSKK